MKEGAASGTKGTGGCPFGFYKECIREWKKNTGKR